MRFAINSWTAGGIIRSFEETRYQDGIILQEGILDLSAKLVNLSWTIQGLWVIEDRIVVLGEASGTPTETFFGVEPTGRSFKTISLDMFTVKNGKLSSAYHVENWVGAMAQVKGE